MEKYAESQSGYKFPGEEVHKEVSMWFLNKGNAAISKNLQEFSKWRTDCNYEDVVADLNNTIRDCFKSAGRIIHVLK